MAHLFQVGAGSGGMPVLDMVCRDERITRVTLVEPDVYKPHNVDRHLFPLSAVGRLKAELARNWLLERRPDLDVRILLVRPHRSCPARSPERDRRGGRPRRLRGGQRDGQVSLRRADAPARLPVDAGRSAVGRHRRVRPLLRPGRALLRLRGELFAAVGEGRGPGPRRRTIPRRAVRCGKPPFRPARRHLGHRLAARPGHAGIARQPGGMADAAVDFPPVDAQARAGRLRGSLSSLSLYASRAGQTA